MFCNWNRLWLKKELCLGAEIGEEEFISEERLSACFGPSLFAAVKHLVSMILLEWMKILKAAEERHFRDLFFPSSDKQVPFWNGITREYSSFVLVLRSRISCKRGEKIWCERPHLMLSGVWAQSFTDFYILYVFDWSLLPTLSFPILVDLMCFTTVS